MSVDNLARYDSWHIYQPSLPPRSRLYQLEPIGIGTSKVESLTSFITRLAEAHCLLPGALIVEIIAPLLDRIFVKKLTSRGLRSLFDRSHALNGNGSMASDFTQALETLTLSNDLRALTLLAWSDIFLPRGLLRTYKAWCPCCYQELWVSSKIIYEPLLWSLEIVKVCPKHDRALSNNCPHCHHQLPLLSWRSRSGYCSNCHKLLFSTNFLSRSMSQVSDYRSTWDIWVEDALGEVIALNPLPNPSKIYVQKNIVTLINLLTEGNIAAFADSLKIPKNTVWGWYKGKIFPTIDALLKISHHIKIPLIDFLIRDLDTIGLNKKQSTVFSSSNSSKRSPPHQFDRQLVQETLLNALTQSEESVPTIKEIAQSLGYNRRLLSRHFPDLCQKLVAKRRYSNKINHAKILTNCSQEVRLLTFKLYEQGEYPTEARISELISKPGYLRYERVRNAFKKAKQEIGLEA